VKSLSSNGHEDERLAVHLRNLDELFRKYGYDGQAAVVEKILGSLRTPNPDHGLLASISMWGGSGAVWEVILSPSTKSNQVRADEIAFRKAIISIASAMDRLGVGTARSRDIARIFQGWIDEGI
jgi:hypothetical protein